MRSMCGAGAGCSAINDQSLWGEREGTSLSALAAPTHSLESAEDAEGGASPGQNGDSSLLDQNAPNAPPERLSESTLDAS